MCTGLLPPGANPIAVKILIIIIISIPNGNRTLDPRLINHLIFNLLRIALGPSYRLTRMAEVRLPAPVDNLGGGAES